MDLISHCIKRNQRVLEGRATVGTLIILLVLSLLCKIVVTVREEPVREMP